MADRRTETAVKARVISTCASLVVLGLLAFARWLAPQTEPLNG
jgi:hypothetical protein